MTLHHTTTTTNQPGAVAIVQVGGDAEEVVALLEKLTTSITPHSRGLTAPGGATNDAPDRARSASPSPAPPAAVASRPLERWSVGRLRLCDFAGIDEGLAGRLSDTTAQLIPHGGLRVVQKLEAWLREHGVTREKNIDTRALYPEADSPIEADMLHAIATAASPAAIDLLAAQPALWRDWRVSNQKSTIQNQNPLQHLSHPPTVVVVGRPNVGKSTLLNRLVGRSASVVADLPGTTRDWVGGLVELTPTGGDPSRDAIAVRWLDTPGLRDSDDAVEQRAIEQSRAVVAAADVLVVMRDPRNTWPNVERLPREPDVWVMNKIDDAAAGGGGGGGSGRGPGEALHLSAENGAGVAALTDAVVRALGLGAIERDRPWAFSGWLERWEAGGRGAGELENYLGVGKAHGH